MELDTAASSVEVTDTGVMIRWSNGARSRFHALWLHHNSSGGGTTGGPGGLIEQVTLADLNPDVFVMFAERNDDGDLCVEFSNGSEAAYAFDWLQAHSHESHELLPPDSKKSFRAGHQIERFSLLDTDQSPSREENGLELLDSIDRWGAAIVTEVSESASDAFVDLFGPIRPTQSPPGNNIGEHVVVAPHTQSSWRTDPDGIVIIQCLNTSGSAGEITLIDGFAIATELQDDDPDAFDALSQTAVTFTCPSDEHLTTRAPVIAVDGSYRVSTIRFDEQALAPLAIEPRQVGDYYRAAMVFTQVVNDPGRAIQVYLQPGQALVVDNHRLLHGRSAVDFGHNYRTMSIDHDWFRRRRRELRDERTTRDAAERHL